MEKKRVMQITVLDLLSQAYIIFRCIYLYSLRAKLKYFISFSRSLYQYFIAEG